MRVPTTALGLLAFVLLLTSTSTAAAQRPTVVLDFEGRGAGRVRSAVIDIVEGRVSLEERAPFEAAAESSGADLATAEGVATVASERGIALVVTGWVTGRGNRAKATVRFLDSEGAEIGIAEDVRVPRNRSTRQRFNRRVRAAFDAAMGVLDQREAVAGGGPAGGGDEGGGEGGDDAEGAAYDDERPDDDEDDEDSGGSGERSRPYVRALVGLDGRTRNATINLDNGLRRTYSATFPQLTLTVEGRPFAGTGGALDGFIGIFDFAIAVGLSSNEELTSGAIVPVDTSAYRLAFLVGYLFDLGVLELGPTFGYTHDAFQLAPNDTMPTATYPALRVAALARIPLAGELVELFADGGVRFILGTGDLTPTFGESTTAFGFDVVGGVMGALDVGFTYSARFGYVGTTLGFQGNGTNVDDTATDGFDGGLFFGAQVGWQI